MAAVELDGGEGWRMRAVQLDGFGGPEVMELREVDRPAPVPTEVLVRVHAAGVNPVDWKTRAAGAFLSSLGTPPYVLGWDVSGVVEEVGGGVARFAVGDEVFGMPRFPWQAGGYADYVTAPSRHFARKPAGLPHVEAAALPLAGLTAWQALVDTARVRAGQRVLVHAAAGGVGHLAVQIAKARGAYVLGTARAAKHDFLRSIGVDEPIDYTAVDFTTAAGDIDVVVDLIGGEYGGRSLRVLRPGGLLVAVTGAGPATLLMAEKAEVRAAQLLVEPDHAGLEGLAALVDAGQLRVHLETVLPLEQAARAHELGESGRTTGKIVLSLVG
jgi:NADPH:quinone reductase-like Zn-dependent oxidoreductase